MSVFKLKDAVEWATNLKKNGGILVSSNGCFDILHRGHAEYLNQARQLGDALIVAVNTDRSIRSLKGPSRPINRELDRAFLLSQLKCVDAVCLFDEDTPCRWLESIQPQIHVKGGDYVAQSLPEFSTLLKWGGRIQILPFKEGYSTSKNIEKIKNLD